MKDKIVEEISKLVDECIELFGILKDNDKKVNFVIKYQKWYTKSLKVVEQLAPDRYQEFVQQYKENKRKEIDYSTYTISDYCLGLTITRGGVKLFDTDSAALGKLGIQLGIMTSLKDRVNSILSNIRSLLEAEIFDSELDSASALLKKGYNRATGAICGVVLEKHFSEVATNHGLSITKKEPTISDYNDLLKKEDVYDTATWRQIQYLGDIRNLCDHDKKVEPTKEQVNDLIIGTDKIIKNVF